ncbi:MAG: outer membrane protein transport protein [Mariprofundus sp.]
MKKTTISLWATSTIFLLAAANASAGGFQIGEQGSGAMGVGNAFTAVANDPSAQWFNPAGSAFQSGTQVMAGGEVIIVPPLKFTSNTSNPSYPSSASMKSKTLVVPHLYVSHALADSPITLGLGVNSPFGLESDWPSTSPFATSNTFSQIKTINFNPNVTWKINDNLAIAVGVDYVLLDKVRLNNSAQLLEGKGDGWGGNVALMYRNDQFSFGISYRSSVKLAINNGTVIGGPALALLGAPGAVGARGTASTQVVLPDQVNAGLAFEPMENVTLSVDVDWVNWKTFDNLDFRYAPSAVATALTGGTNFRTLKENWKATVAFRAGAEWRYTEDMRLRAGYTFDPTPVDDRYYTPGIPDRDRHLFTAGLGYDFSDAVTVDLAYMFVYFVDRNQTLSTGTDAVRNGTYSGDVHILAGSAVYRF